MHAHVHLYVRANGNKFLNQGWGVLFIKVGCRKMVSCEDLLGCTLCVRAGKKEVVGKPRSAVAACPSRTRSAPVTRRRKCVCELRSFNGGSSSGRGRIISGKDFFFYLPNFGALKARLFVLRYELLASAFL